MPRSAGGSSFAASGRASAKAYAQAHGLCVIRQPVGEARPPRLSALPEASCPRGCRRRRDRAQPVLAPSANNATFEAALLVMPVRTATSSTGRERWLSASTHPRLPWGSRECQRTSSRTLRWLSHRRRVSAVGRAAHVRSRSGRGFYRERPPATPTCRARGLAGVGQPRVEILSPTSSASSGPFATLALASAFSPIICHRIGCYASLTMSRWLHLFRRQPPPTGYRTCQTQRPWA
jgi:hypothetical protein